MKSVKIITLFLNLIWKSVYAILVFITDSFRTNSTLILAILTGIYVFLTLNIVKESQRQSDIMLQSSKHIQRAYLHIDAYDFYAETGPIHVKKILEELEKLKDLPIENLSGKVKLKLCNEGHTPAYPVFWGCAVVPLSLKELNIHDSLLQCDTFTFKSMIELPATIVQNHDFTWVKTFKNLSTDKNGHLYIHAYFIYNDVFGDYHMFYAVFQYAIDVKRGGAFGFPPFIDIDTFSEQEVTAILLKTKQVGYEPKKDTKSQ